MRISYWRSDVCSSDLEVEQVIKDGAADMVSMVRAHIADPDIVRKTREGRVDEIRPCIGCNQGCIGGLYRYGQVGCAVNVAVGRSGRAPCRERVCKSV